MDNLLIKPERISAALTGDLKVKGEGDKVDIAGKIEIARLRVTLPDHEQKEIPEIQYVDVEKDEFEIERRRGRELFR